MKKVLVLLIALCGLQLMAMEPVGEDLPGLAPAEESIAFQQQLQALPAEVLQHIMLFLVDAPSLEDATNLLIKFVRENGLEFWLQNKSFIKAFAVELARQFKMNYLMVLTHLGGQVHRSATLYFDWIYEQSEKLSKLLGKKVEIYNLFPLENTPNILVFASVNDNQSILIKFNQFGILDQTFYADRHFLRPGIFAFDADLFQQITHDNPEKLDVFAVKEITRLPNGLIEIKGKITLKAGQLIGIRDNPQIQVLHLLGAIHLAPEASSPSFTIRINDHGQIIQ